MRNDVDRGAKGSDKRVRATHALFFSQLIVFLVLIIGHNTVWFRWLLGHFAVGDAASILARPWSLLSYPFLNVHPLEFVVAAAILLLAGVAVEERLGRARFLALYFLTAAFVALCHAGLFAAGVVTQPLFAGALGASAGVLTAFLLLHGHERNVGNLPYPVFYLLTACSLLLVVVAVDWQNQLDHRKDAKEHAENAYKVKDRTVAKRHADLDALRLLEEQQQDVFRHLLGLALGGLSLVLTSAGGRLRARYRVRREIRGLQEEVDARARVELLLVKISEGGIDSLTRHERKFLRYASRFYRSRMQEV